MSKRRHERWIAFREAMLNELPAILGCTPEELPPVLAVMGRPKALKVGIALDLLAKFPKADEPKLADWLRRWTGHWEYLKRIAHGCNRHGLEGNDMAPITDDDRGCAREKLGISGKGRRDISSVVAGGSP
jgi:sRNA-binding protein